MSVWSAHKQLLLALWLAIVSLGQMVSAAEIEFSNAAPCTLNITGFLEPGDAARLAELTKDMYRFPEEDIVLCLDSEGGDLAEAISLADMIETEVWSTYIGPGAKCFSGCAVAFMMGRELAFDRPRDIIRRILHIDGQLGFHRPYLPEELEEQPTFGFAGATFDEAVKTVLDVVAIANRPRRGHSYPVIRSDLLERMFDTSRDSLFLIDTLEKASRWDIQIDGADFAFSRLTQERAEYACNNLPRWARIADAQTGYSFTTFDEPDVPDWLTYVVGDQDGISEYGHYCLFVAVPTDEGARVFGCIHDGNNGFFFGGSPCNPDLFHREDRLGGGASDIPLKAFFPPQTKLSELIPSGRSHVGSWDWLSKMRRAAWHRCEVARPDDVTSTQRTVMGPRLFANIRSAPSQEADVIAQVRPWSRLWITAKDPIYVGSTELQSFCSQTCGALDRNTVGRDVFDDRVSSTAQAFERECVIPHNVWWPVRLESGIEGYISAALMR